jgi:hypothetical protein
MKIEPIQPCMGGFCRLRDKCLHHADPDNSHRPSERMCSPGKEEAQFFIRHVTWRDQISLKEGDNECLNT